MVRAILLSRRDCLACAAAAAVTPRFRLKPDRKSSFVTPEQFGALGDGVTNDTDAFAAMATFVNKRRGGAISLRPTTYIVGKQAPDPTMSAYAFAPADILEFDGCSEQLSIVGNGARIRCADGLRFGTFDPSTGEPTANTMPYYGQGELATPYVAMISAKNCSGGIDISNLELDGNLQRLMIGGPYGDTGRQIPAVGLRLLNNSCSEQVTQVYTHHHALDGLYIDGPAERNAASTIESVVSEYNVRQGCSLVGGRNYSFKDCRFNHTGKAGLASAPGAGIDIEAETKPIRNLSFSGCEFSNNTGVGMLADSGDSESATLDNCRFVGTTAWSAWPRKPLFRFTACTFVGSICNTFGDVDPERAAQFANCVFLDDASLSPTGEVFKPSVAIASLNICKNVLFDGCRFSLTGQSVLPYSTSALYNNCTMSQVASKTAYPRGTYTGVNEITGPVVLNGSIILGDVTVNGQLKPRTA